MTKEGGDEPFETTLTVERPQRPSELRVVDMGSNHRGRPREALVVLDQTGCPRAYLNLCRHLPIPLDGGSREFWNEEHTHLMCGTHGALYRLQDGLCVEGPCEGKRLLELEIRPHGDKLQIVKPPLDGSEEHD